MKPTKLLDTPIDQLIAAARKTLHTEIARLRRASLEAADEGKLLKWEHQANLVKACQVAGQLKKVDIAEQTEKKKRLARLLPQMSDAELDEMERKIRAGEDLGVN